MNAIKKVLITGGLGFIGLNIAHELIRQGYHIVMFDNLSPQIHGSIPIVKDPILTSEKVRVIRGSIIDRNALQAALTNVQAVVHLAAETGTAQSMYQIAHYNNINTQGTAILLDILANEQHSVKKIVVASSRSVYGEGAYCCEKCGRITPNSRTQEQLDLKQWELVCPQCDGKLRAIPTPENSRVHPASIYAATKYAQEELIRIAGSALGIGTVILRLQNVYGAGQSLNNPYTGILSIFSTRIRQGLSLPIFEDGLESRDFVYVTDIAKAFCLALENDKADGGVFNIGSGEQTTVFEIATLLVRILGGKVQPHITGQYRLGDIRHCYADLAQARNILGYQPSVGLGQGMEQFASWTLTQPLPEDQLDRANDELRNRGMMK